MNFRGQPLGSGRQTKSRIFKFMLLRCSNVSVKFFHLEKSEICNQLIRCPKPKGFSNVQHGTLHASFRRNHGNWWWTSPSKWAWNLSPTWKTLRKRSFECPSFFWDKWLITRCNLGCKSAEKWAVYWGCNLVTEPFNPLAKYQPGQPQTRLGTALASLFRRVSCEADIARVTVRTVPSLRRKPMFT